MAVRLTPLAGARADLGIVGDESDESDDDDSASLEMRPGDWEEGGGDQMEAASFLNASSNGRRRRTAMQHSSRLGEPDASAWLERICCWCCRGGWARDASGGTRSQAGGARVSVARGLAAVSLVLVLVVIFVVVGVLLLLWASGETPRHDSLTLQVGVVHT